MTQRDPVEDTNTKHSSRGSADPAISSAPLHLHDRQESLRLHDCKESFKTPQNINYPVIGVDRNGT